MNDLASPREGINPSPRFCFVRGGLIPSRGLSSMNRTTVGG
jgi:hypothetical protein